MAEKNAKVKRQIPFPLWSIGFIVGVILLVLGVWQDQFADIYRKAVMICLECIGIG